MTTPQPIPPESEPETIKPQRYPFHIEGRMYLPLETCLPVEACICCGKPAVGVFSKSLRRSKSPASWYLPRPTTQIGLCKAHKENRLVALSLTYSLLIIGLLLLIVGIATLSIPTIVVGTVAAVFSGFFRSRESIQGVDKGDGIYEVIGACDSYVRMLPEHELVRD